jgi:ElaB/YqjD/DUF883 family membrane-anchored ribosome-binding protein
MSQAYEPRQRRSNGQIKHLREDVTTLQKDFSKLGDDFGKLVKTEWNGIGRRVNGGVAYMEGKVRQRPFAAVGAAAGVGLLAGIALTLAARRRR